MFKDINTISKIFLKNYNNDYNLPPFTSSIPKQYLKYFTVSRLFKEGFQKLQNGVYSKNIDKVLTIIVFKYKTINDYIWYLNKSEFKRMLKELETIRKYASKKSEALFNIYKSINKTEKIDRYHKEFSEAQERIYKLRREFLVKYEKFVNYFTFLKTPSTYFRCKSFVFDACHTREELNLFLEFIKSYMEIFGGLYIMPPYKQKISLKRIKLGMIAYYLIHSIVKEIRKLYLSDVKNEDIANRFSMITSQDIENITCDSKKGKGWKYKASEFSLDFASSIASTTKLNFRQILKHEKKCIYKAKELIQQVKKPEEILNGKLKIPIDKLGYLEREQIVKKDYINAIKHLLFKLSSSSLPKKR